MRLLHGASCAHTSTCSALLCSALWKLSPPVGLCVSASHQTRLYHSKQAVRRMLPREKTVSAAHRAHTHCFGCRKKALPLPSVALASPQKTKCARHPSVVMMSVLVVPCPICDTAAFARSPSAGLFVCSGRAAYICEG